MFQPVSQMTQVDLSSFKWTAKLAKPRKITPSASDGTQSDCKLTTNIMTRERCSQNLTETYSHHCILQAKQNSSTCTYQNNITIKSCPYVPRTYSGIVPIISKRTTQSLDRQQDIAKMARQLAVDNTCFDNVSCACQKLQKSALKQSRMAFCIPLGNPV